MMTVRRPLVSPDDASPNTLLVPRVHPPERGQWTASPRCRCTCVACALWKVVRVEKVALFVRDELTTPKPPCRSTACDVGGDTRRTV
jgi:hypothetical protein